MNTKQKITILFIDDDHSFLELMEMGLSIKGYHVLTSDSVTKAVDIINNNKIDFIVLDMRMDEMDGLSFLNWFRNDGKFDIPVVVSTSIAREDIEDNVTKAGANDLIIKPFSLKQLISKLDNLAS